MKKVLFIISCLLLASCSGPTNPNYEKNLATAKKIFQFHGEENLEGIKALVSKDINSIPPFYGSEPQGYEPFIQLVEGYQNAYDELNYTAKAWLPGTDREGNLDGSVRTYGNWTGVHAETGKKLDLNGYWYFNFDENGFVVEQGDFFDIGGMVGAMSDQQTHVVEMIVMNKTDSELEAFVEMYTTNLKAKEPNVLGWSFHKTGKNKITLVERYFNEEAWFNHAKNVSPGGISEAEFKLFMETFTIDKITVYGNASDKMKETFTAFGINNVSYDSTVFGFNR